VSERLTRLFREKGELEAELAFLKELAAGTERLRVYQYELEERVVQLGGEVAKLKAELEARKLSGKIFDAAHQATRDGAAERLKGLRTENARLRDLLRKVQSFASDRESIVLLGVLAFGKLEHMIEQALGPLPGEE